VGKRRGCCMGKRKSPLTKDETQLPSSVTMMTRSANQRLSAALTEHVRRYWEMRALDDLGGDDRFLQIQRGIIRGLVMSQVIAEGHFHTKKQFTQEVIETEKIWIDVGRMNYLGRDGK